MSGILSMPAEQYHSADGVSKSMLDWITPPRRPSHFWSKFIGKEIEDKQTPAMRLGSIAHRCILEPDTLEGAFHQEPDGMSFTTKEGKAWRNEHLDRPILTADDVSTITKMRDAFWRHPLAKRIMHKAQTEQSLFAEDSHGTLRKCRLDALTLGSAIPDVKTCESADADEFGKSLAKYRYYVQAAYYIDLCKLVGIEKREFLVICIEKSAPYCVAVHEIDPADVETGRMCYQRDLQVFRNCLESNSWPGFSSEIGTVCLPEWERKKLSAETGR